MVNFSNIKEDTLLSFVVVFVPEDTPTITLSVILLNPRRLILPS